MLKYYILLGLGFIAVTLYVFLQDPCGNSVRNDFLKKYPRHEIIYFGAEESVKELSSHTVRCLVRYRISDGVGTYEDVWEYRDSGEGWELFRVVEEQVRIE